MQVEEAAMDADARVPSIPTVTPNALRWLDGNWPFAGTVVAVFLAVLLPLVVGVWPTALVLLYLLLLLYQVHQVEEHYGDRFRRFLNQHLAGGAEALTPRATMWINVLVVWALYLLVILLAAFVDVGFGLIIVYTSLLNAVAHILAAVVLRRPNPGVWTAIGLFVPFGLWALVVVARASGLGAAGHVLGIALAVLGHAVILLVVRQGIRDSERRVA